MQVMQIHRYVAGTVSCLADGGGWREDQHMWDGQGLKDPCFLLKLYLESQNHREKLNMRQKLGSLTR
jgi:hypothetical protein